MKKILLLIYIVFLCGKVVGQNLVPNGSFETITSCDSLGGGFDYIIAPPWDSPNSGGSADLFNTCATNSNWNIPSNFAGYQYPHSGNGYAGAEFYYLNDNTFREYIQAELDSILKPQHKYCVTFYVSLCKGLASNNIGMHFSQTHTFVSGSTRLNLIPQILDTNIVSDTTNWTLISGEYISTGGEQYIIIGNFNTASTTSALSVSGGSDSYYYIDDVSIVDCTGSGLGVAELNNNNTITLSPNPATNELKVESKDLKIKNINIYNVLGCEILKQVQNDQRTTIDVSSFANGIYFVEVQTESFDKLRMTGVVRKKFVKQ